jgi:enoyl-CoA hydratase/carnithine racemase
MTDSYITLTKEAPLGLITLDRPPANSYDLKFMQDLDAAIEGAAADDDIKAVLVVSASEKFFCGGADIKAFLANTPEANMEMINFAHQALAKIAQIPKVFIAVINGHAMGGGAGDCPVLRSAICWRRQNFAGSARVNLGVTAR